MADVLDICGSCDERFAEVRSALAQNFREHGEVGAAVAVTIDGRPVVDLWAGWADRARPGRRTVPTACLGRVELMQNCIPPRGAACQPDSGNPGGPPR